MLYLCDERVLSGLEWVQRATHRAVLVVGYGLSTRLGEYLPKADEQFDPRRHVSVENSIVWVEEARDLIFIKRIQAQGQGCCRPTTAEAEVEYAGRSRSLRAR